MPDADQKFDHSFNSTTFSDVPVVTYQPIPAVPIPSPPAFNLYAYDARKNSYHDKINRQ